MRVVTSLVLMVLIATVAVSGSTREAVAEPAGEVPRADRAVGDPDGFVDQAWYTQRQNEYLAFATQDLNESSPDDVLAHLERAERDPTFDFDASAITPEDFAGTLDFIAGFNDTSDFDLLRMVALYEEHGDELTPELRAAIEDVMVGYRYWFTDPLPEGVIDNKYFWSENHRIIFHTLEYLAGQSLPDTTFTITGEPGAEHQRRGKERIEAWLAEKARWGFSEWHSDVYYTHDLRPLLMLVEHAEDPELARKAAMVLDLLLYDMALHQHEGNQGVTHGRSYMKDKSRATDEGGFEPIKLLFDTTDLGYPSEDTAATFLASSEKYRLPEVIRRAATTDETITDREHMGVDFDLNRPYEENPTSPAPGVSLDDVEDVDFWWGKGGLTAWPVVPLTLKTIEDYNLFETKLFKPYEPLVDLVDGDPQAASQLAYQLRCQINFGLLDEVDTVTYRSDDVMLSSAQDYRPGCGGEQYHAWQATLDEDAVVFTTHPGNEPFTGTDRYEDDDKYWTGTGTMPRSAQQGAAAIHLYAPGFASPDPEGPLGSFSYLDYTHAFFPTERFDEVRRVDNWTLGRKGDAYVALYSWRDVEWKPHDPAEEFTGGLTENYDLVAPGGADNVWISEVADAGDWSSFDDFVGSVTAAPVSVTDLGTTEDGLPAGFDVTYQSPAEGEMSFSQTGPFGVGGEEVALEGDKRYDNAFGTTDFGAEVVDISDGEVSLSLDFANWQRTVAPSEPSAACPDATGAGEPAVVRLAYLSVLERCPDPGGLEFWTGFLAERDSAARGAFLRLLSVSAEARKRTVEAAYERVLGRPADRAGRAFWAGELSRGVAVSELVARLAASGEAWRAAGRDPEAFVEGAYDAVLGRPADLGGIAHHAGRILAGASRLSVTRDLATSTEAARATVRAAYATMLRRGPDPAELAFVAGLYRSSQDWFGLRSSLAARQEFFDLAQTVPPPRS